MMGIGRPPLGTADLGSSPLARFLLSPDEPNGLATPTPTPALPVVPLQSPGDAPSAPPVDKWATTSIIRGRLPSLGRPPKTPPFALPKFHVKPHRSSK